MGLPGTGERTTLHITWARPNLEATRGAPGTGAASQPPAPGAARNLLVAGLPWSTAQKPAVDHESLAVDEARFPRPVPSEPPVIIAIFLDNRPINIFPRFALARGPDSKSHSRGYVGRRLRNRSQRRRSPPRLVRKARTGQHVGEPGCDRMKLEKVKTHGREGNADRCRAQKARTFDVLIVGAKISGIGCAYHL